MTAMIDWVTRSWSNGMNNDVDLDDEFGWWSLQLPPPPPLLLLPSLPLSTVMWMRRQMQQLLPPLDDDASAFLSSLPSYPFVAVVDIAAAFDGIAAVVDTVAGNTVVDFEWTQV